MSSHKPSDYVDTTPLIARIVLANGSSPDELSFYLQHSMYDVKALFKNLDGEQINIFLAINKQKSDKSAELEILLHQLDDISVLFFNDNDIDKSYAAPILNICMRHFDRETSAENELPILLRYCFDKFPLLETKSYQLISKKCDCMVNSLETLLEFFQGADEEILQDAFFALLLTFKETIPKGTEMSRYIPQPVCELELMLEQSEVDLSGAGFFSLTQDAASSAEDKPHQENGTLKK